MSLASLQGRVGFSKTQSGSALVQEKRSGKSLLGSSMWQGSYFAMATAAVDYFQTMEHGMEDVLKGISDSR